MDLTQNSMKPRPMRNGIVNTVIREGKSYDFWALRQDGSFYLLQTLFEDSQGANELFFNTRIVRTTEMLMYLARLYEGLNVPREYDSELYPSPCRARWQTYIGYKQPSDASFSRTGK